MEAAMGIGRRASLLALCWLAGCATPAWRLEWTDGPNLPEPVSGAGFSWYGDGGVLIGGMTLRDGKPAAVTDVRRFDPFTGDAKGAPLPPLPRRLAHFGLCVVDDGIVVVGGTDGDLAAADALVLTGENGRALWKPLPKLPEKRFGPVAAAIDRTVYVIGGTATLGEPGPVDHTIYRYDFDRPENGWVSLGLAPGVGRRFAGSATVQERIFVFGGVAEDSLGVVHAFADSYRFDPGRDEWTRLADLPEPLVAPAVADVGGRYILIVGGAGAEEVRPGAAGSAPYRTAAYLYDTATDMYHRVEDAPTPAIHSAVTIRDGVLFLLGGEDRPGHAVAANRQALLSPRGYRLTR